MRRKFQTRLFAVSSVAALNGLLLVSQAVAQEVEPEVTESRQATITVTAQKREQSLQDVAGSVAAFDTKSIEERALNSVENLAISVPGVVYQETNGSSQISIRGVGLLVNTGVAEANVATHIDGIFQGRASASTLTFLDLERVEILRGPQGTLYGRNATGGSINFILAKPRDTFEGFAGAGVGSYSQAHVKGYVTGPIAGDKILGRLSAVYEESDGYYDNVTLGTKELGKQSFGIRGALRFLPSDDLAIDLSALHQKEEGSYPVQNVLRGPSPLVAGLEGSGVLPPGFVTVARAPWQTAGETSPITETETTAVTLEVNWSVSDEITFKSLTGYTDHQLGPQIFDADGTSLGIVNVGTAANPRVGTAKAFSQEFNLAGSTEDGDLTWLVGAYFYDEDHDHTIPTPFPDPLIQTILGAGFAPIFGPGTRFMGQTPSISEKTESQAVFADATFALTDQLRFNAGARYSDDTKDISQTTTADLLAGGAAPVTLPLCTDLRNTLSFSETNYKLRAEYDPTADVLVYGQFQNGFKDGGVNLSTCGDLFPKEQIDAIEFGAKSSWFDGAVTLNASLFSYDYSNLQILAFRDNLSFVDTIPKSEMKGGEIELVARPTDDFSFDVGIALLDGKIEDFDSFDESNPAAGVQDLSGNDLPSSPDYTILVGANYAWNADWGTIDFRGEVFGSAEYNFRPFGNEIDRQKKYMLVNLYATYTDPSDRYQVRGFVRNALDEDYIKFLLYSSPVGVAGEYAAPQTWGVELGVRF